MVAECAKGSNPPELRAVGSEWSLSPVAATTGRTIETKRRNIAFPIPKSYRTAAYKAAFPDANLDLIEAGNTIGVVSRYLDQADLSLMAQISSPILNPN